MNRIIILILIFIICGIAAFSQTNVVVKVGVQLLGNLHFEPTNTNQEMEMGTAMAVEIAYAAAPFVEVGGGIEYMLECGQVDYPDEKINYIPVYGLVRGKYPLGFFTPFAVGKVGYNLLLANDNFSGGADLIGGLYWSVGAGVLIMGFIFIEVAYANNYGLIDVGSGVDVVYSHFDFSGGISLTF